MRKYRYSWLVVVGLIGLLGLVTGLAYLSLSAILLIFLCAAGIVGSVRLSLGLASGAPGGAWIRGVAAEATWAGAAVVAVCGYAAAIGTAVLPLLFLVTATSPPVVGYLAGRLTTETDADESSAPPAQTEIVVDHPPEPQCAEETVNPLSKLSDFELCIEWRRSYTALEKAGTPVERLRIVASRQGYLDELERRRPDCFADWLAAGARAAGDPSKYFLRGGDRSEPRD